MFADNAKSIASDALLWLANDEDLLMPFLNATGTGLQDIRARADDPEFLGFVLDFVMSDDGIAERFASTRNLNGEDMMAARAALPGGDLPNWT